MASLKANSKCSFAEVVKSSLLTGANKIPIKVSVFKRIQFPSSSPFNNPINHLDPLAHSDKG
jgi:hypothetical protein